MLKIIRRVLTNREMTWGALAVSNLLLILILLVAQAAKIYTQTATDAPLDFDGDGRTDYCVVRNENGTLIWYIAPINGSPQYGLQWGVLGDVAVPEDFDGDGRDDIAVWRPAAGSASFYIINSQTNTVRIVQFGQLGDDPSTVADYDGDNRADLSVYRNASSGGQSYFFYLASVNNPSGNITYVPWGTSGDFPAPGDYDGDGRGDFAIQRDIGGTGYFYLLQSSAGIAVLPFGLSTDLIASGDYDGDLKTDICVVRREMTGFRWWIRRSSDGAVQNRVFGHPDLDVISPGDYTGDGLTDLAVWRPDPNPDLNYFWVRSSSSGTVTAYEWGLGVDYPVSNYLVH